MKINKLSTLFWFEKTKNKVKRQMKITQRFRFSLCKI